MLKGAAPYDAKTVQAALDIYIDASKKLPGLFPEDSKTGEKTQALPEIWTHKDDFDARFVKFGPGCHGRQGIDHRRSQPEDRVPQGAREIAADAIRSIEPRTCEPRRTAGVGTALGAASRPGLGICRPGCSTGAS